MSAAPHVLPRRLLFGLLGALGLAKAQRATTGADEAIDHARFAQFAAIMRVRPRWQTGKALNDQCPVCSEMAAPYKPDHSRLIRCVRCNAAFFQDAEAK